MRFNPIHLAICLALLASCSRTPGHVQVAAQDGTIGRAAAQESPSEAEANTTQARGSEAGIDAAHAQVADVEYAPPAGEGDQLQAASAKSAGQRMDRKAPAAPVMGQSLASPMLSLLPPPSPPAPSPTDASVANTENYARITDNPLRLAADDPVSTFSIDVDTGSYSNVRRMLMAGQRPPADSVRAEEMINYFDYGYAVPATRDTPFQVSTEIAPAPWNAKRLLLQIGIQGYRVADAAIPASNIVLLIDTSGSMQSPDKLPLLKHSFSEMVLGLRKQDRISVVVYAGSAGLVLPPTAGDQKDRILAALDQLQAGGSTNGGEGLQLAYAMARQAFIANGVNRVILATDGDFNVGTVDQAALETMVANQRESGVALTTLGFGTDNYNDAMAERLADIGNGNHAYIDTPGEARKVLGEELSSTMLTIASDVKIQMEFNPALVAEYRLIGYENRALRREDFNNDKVDAGEIGAGHDVTALYEITLAGTAGAGIDPLRYGKPVPLVSKLSGELAWLRLRYKLPGSSRSKLLERALRSTEIRREPSARLRWSAAVAAYADLLRGGSNVGEYGWNQVSALGRGALGQDRWGHRAEFLDLVERARVLTGSAEPIAVSE